MRENKKKTSPPPTLLQRATAIISNRRINFATMYKPEHFTETDREAINDFIEANPFMTIMGHDGEKCYATQIPVMTEQREDVLYIKGHVSRYSDHYPVLAKNSEVLGLFTGPHCYVSASWYTKRGQASTWNYMSVQVRGSMRWFNENETMELVRELTHHYENGQENPELLEDMPGDYVSEHVKAIAGFEITVTSLDATFKLSQNRDDESYKNIVTQLMATDDIQSIMVAGEMMKLRPTLFE